MTTGVIAVAARGVRKSKTATDGSRRHAPSGGVFVCERCRAGIRLEYVSEADAERVDGSVTGYVVIRHHCECTPGQLLSTRAWGSYPGFVALFGRIPLLPYRSPFEPVQLTPADPTMVRWGWELEQVASVDEFLLFLDDARSRQAGTG